jgi:hypothetical protein
MQKRQIAQAKTDAAFCQRLQADDGVALVALPLIFLLRRAEAQPSEAVFLE